MGGAHLGQHLVQPLQRPVQVDLYPARSGRHVLAVVLGSPTLHERHTNRTHLRQLVDSFETMINALGQQLCKLPVVEDLQRTSGRYLTHGGGVEPVVVITVSTLDEDGGVRQALCVNFSPDVVQMYSFPYVTSGVLDRRIPVHIT